MIEMRVAEIRVSGVGTAPLVVVAEVGGAGRLLPIWMSHTGASAIFSATEDPDPARPSIHDVTAALAAAMPTSLTAVQITECQEGQYWAELVFPDRGVPCRASDAIAIALRAGCPLRCAEAVLDEYGVAAAPVPVAEAAPSEEEVERFREFLDTVTPEDFSGEDKP